FQGAVVTPADAREPLAQVHFDGRQHVAIHGDPLGGAAGPDVRVEGGLQRSAQKTIPTKLLQVEVPVACSLEASDLRERAAEWSRLLGRHLVSRESIPGGIRIQVEP